MANLLLGACLLFLPVGLLAYLGIQACREGDQFRGMALLAFAMCAGLLYFFWLTGSIEYYQAKQPLPS